MLSLAAANYVCRGQRGAAGARCIATAGLHARPAALLARRAKTLGAQISLAAHGRVADARSVSPSWP